MNFNKSIMLIFIILSGCSEIKLADNVDVCLDQGGSFDYENERCDFKDNHPMKDKE